MKKFLAAVPILVVLLFGLGLVADAQNVTQYFSATCVFSWDAVTTDIEGGPETISYYELAAFPANTVLFPPPTPAPVPLATTQIPGDTTTGAGILLWTKIPSGTAIRLSVRCSDLAGNLSDWADPLDGILDMKKPHKPNKPWWKVY